jgi:hypothetical protein
MKASEKSADHSSRDVGRHGAAHAASGPFLIHVGEHDSNDARHEKALGETPENQGAQAGGSRRQSGGNGQQEQRGHDHLLASAALGNHADDGGGESGGKNGGAYRQTHFQFGGMENLAQERQQGLGAVDVEKRAHAGQHGRDGRLVGFFHRK